MTVILLNLVTAEEAEQLDGNALQGIGGSIPVTILEDISTYKAPKDIRVSHCGVHTNRRRFSRVPCITGYCQMQGPIALRGENQA